MTLLHVLFLSFVEGLTEYLPISSTGHLILTSAWLGLPHDDFYKVFTVCCQFGAILAIVVLYWRRFFMPRRKDFSLKLVVGMIPAVVVGLLFRKQIEGLLESVFTVAMALQIGGVVLLAVDHWFPCAHGEDTDVEEISYRQAFVIGLWQVLAMIPGVSRSGATIVGGLQQGLNRKTAAEFSFLLGAPTIAGATVLFLFKHRHELSGNPDQWKILAIANVVSFLVAMVAVKTFVSLLSRRGFFGWGVYRIVVGLIVLGCLYYGVGLVI